MANAASKILPDLSTQAKQAVNNLSTTEDVNPTKVNNLGAEITGAFDKHMINFMENFTDWSELSSQMPDQRFGNVMIAKIKFPINQVLQALWQAVYGNRTKEEVERHQKLELSSVRFSALENMNYRDTVVSSKYEVDTNGNVTGELPEEGAQHSLDLATATAITNQAEGQLRYATMKSLLDGFTSLYELTCEDTWKYVPWQEVDKRKADTASVAQAIMARRSKLPTADEQA